MCYHEGFSGGSDSKESAYGVIDQGRSLGQDDPMEKVIETHSSILSGKIPWVEEFGRLQSMGSQRVRHD